MIEEERIFWRVVDRAGLRQWFVRTSEGVLGPYASWQESRSQLDQHLIEVMRQQVQGTR